MMATVMLHIGIVVPPTIVPNSRREFEGEQAQEFSIRCSARGKPDPKYVFYKVISSFNFKHSARICVLEKCCLASVV